MEITLQKIKIRALVKGYKDTGESGVFAYHGKLNLRPPYQREFVYGEKERNAVIESIQQNFPLSIIYFYKNEDGSYELIDGQQRVISICQYVAGDFAINYKFMYNLTEEERNQILDYELLVHICEGTEKEKLDWFQVINNSGNTLTKQELINATYTGSWLKSAQKYFSKTNCPAYQLAKDFINRRAFRQEILETALFWISHRDNIAVEEYMAKHQHDEDSDELQQYFQDVFDWVKKVFPTVRKEMKGLDWGIFYNKYKDNQYDSEKLEEQIGTLMKDGSVELKKGIYEYLLSGNEKYLNLRIFKDTQKAQKYAEQEGICPICKKHFERHEMEADHIKPWSEGGKTVLDNCQMLCTQCHREKDNK